MSKKKRTRNSRSQSNRSTKRNKRKNGSKNSIWKKILLSAVGLVALAFLSGVLLFFFYASQAPEVKRADLVDAVPTQFLDKDGNLFKELGANAQNRDLVDVEGIPQVLQDAILSVEDRRFYEHNGIDPVRIVGAFAANIRGGGISQGGSTITQQLIKLSYFSHTEEDQTIERKAKEAWMSIQLEKEVPKDEILALYINKVYMANNVYGMGTAAEYYFGKDLTDITLSEAAALAGMPQAPNYYDPYTNPEELKNRRDLVLATMVDNGKITEAEREEAASVSITENLVDHTNDKDQSLIIDAYLQIAMDEVKEKTGLDVSQGGMVVQTNLDLAAQQHLYDTVNTDEYIQFPNDEVQTAATLVDVETGAVTAVIGNRKKNVQLGINYADLTVKSVGSTIKPLIDYGPAIEYLDYSTGKLVVDEEWSYPSTGDPLNNYDNAFKGDMTVREALVDSRNVPAAKTLLDVGFDNATAFLNKLGIQITNKDENGNETNELFDSNAIGGEISSVNLAAAYAAFANGGTYNEPYTVQSVRTSDGEIFEFNPKGTTAMKDSTAYMITDMLKDVVTESAPEVIIPGLPQAGKTGTTDFNDVDLELVGAEGLDNIGKDSWYVGYTTNYALSVWMGYEDTKTEGHYLDYETRSITRYIYRELMNFVHQDLEPSDWTRPDSVKEELMEKFSNPIMKPGPNTPANYRISELFVSGTEPTSTSKKYGISLEAPKGLKATYNKDKDELVIQWNKYKSSQDNSTPQYTITAGSNPINTTDTQVTIKNPGKGTINISLVAKLGTSTSPSSTISITIEEPKKEEEEKEEEKESEKESQESASSSSEESSSEEESSSSIEESSESKEEEEESIDDAEDENEENEEEEEEDQEEEEVTPDSDS
ncbi:PBP1A family penicillin-binding protein [Jeotgalibaca sp. MA1X17-3]|uniref:transglycosylase domain-containing protein n=1 Tax=Jeotgalibaca sp. MA1X17-3 TaxID=2908211 RepID=UPI001F3FAA9B|nr:PBP1A family penicillin-binding protein [Jeotgalibaca sp. MA1X17-3]UJF14817.1 PBP1A family penicillin-binding protein [Jeotgalibaca sp. MA1X17-3]